MATLPPAVNFHVNRACNARCTFCFATFPQSPATLSLEQALSLVNVLAESGCRKLNLAGGEPTLWPHTLAVLQHAKSLGLTTSIVTNGFRLNELLDRDPTALDWVGLSVDSASEETLVALGRSDGQHVARCTALAQRCHTLGIRLKLNSVVTALNHHQDLSPLVRTLRPARWKVFQVLPVEDQNGARVKPLLISDSEFLEFVQRHAHLAKEGLAPVVEDNHAMRGSYAMVGPQGRFFGNSSGQHTYSQPILQVGVSAALSQVGFSGQKFQERGGNYQW